MQALSPQKRPYEASDHGARAVDIFVNILSLLTIPVNGAGQSKRNKVFVDRERPFSQKIVKHATTAHSHLLEAGPEEE